MRNLTDPEIDRYRAKTRQILEFYGSFGDHETGCFCVPSCVDYKELMVIASANSIAKLGSERWDHVSVSRKNRTPTWGEMEQVKRLFFRDDEVAMQLHVTPKDHISVHPHCLHIWRPVDQAIPLPPPIMVG